MFTLLLIRHGKAAAGVGLLDADRPLTDEGAIEVRHVGAALRGLGMAVDKIAASPLLRAAATAELVAEELGITVRVDDCAPLAPEAALEDSLLEVVRLARGCRGLAVVSHMPGIADLAQWLLRPGERRPIGFVPGAVACVEFEGEPARGSGILRWLRSPRELELALAPAQVNP